MIAASWASLAQECVGFLERPITPGGTNGAISVHAADMDGDGDLDALSASFNDDTIAWHENRPGEDPAWRIHPISTEAAGATSVFAADINGDGALDVLSASAYDNAIAWYQNLGGSPPAFIRRFITRGAAHARAVSAADMDGDGDVDVLSASFVDDTISWFENQRTVEDPNVSFSEHVITTGAFGASAVAAADVDGDGDMDALAASYLIDTVAWYENQPGTQVGEDGEEYEVLYFIEHLVTTTADGARAVFPVHVDDDGLVDLLVASSEDDTVAWYENQLDADPAAWEFHALDTEADGAKSVHAAGAGDGLVLLAASGRDDTITWYESDGGSPPLFDTRAVLDGVTSVDAVFAADMDGDGQADALYASSVPGEISTADRVAWFRNEPELTEQAISGTALGAFALVTADMDSDTDVDVVATDGAATIGWYENLQVGDEPTTWEFHAIHEEAGGASSLFVADMGGSGLPDIVAAFEETDRIVWLENLGDETSFTEHLVSSATDGPRSVFAVDLDGDLDPDVLSASFNDDLIAWHENRPGEDPAWVAHTVSDDSDGPISVYAADLDGDGAPDLLAAWFEDDRIVWYESDGLAPPGFTAHILASNVVGEADYRANGVTSVSAADLDGDGDMDVLAEIFNDGQIVWFENDVDPDDSEQRIFTVQLITSAPDLPTGMSTADVDLDGNLDLLSTSTGNDWVVWYENGANDPLSFTPHVVGSSGKNPRAVVAANFDADDQVELFAGFEFQAAWYESVGELCHGFDANDDGTIDGTELSWLGRAFTRPVTDPDAEWWAALDYNADGVVDGDDLAILSSDGVWGQTVTTDEVDGTCQYTCR